MSKKKNNLEPRPEVGKFYHFWDDGKISASRHYICKCEEIVTPVQAQEIIIYESVYADYPMSLYDYRKVIVDNHRQSKGCIHASSGSTEDGAPWLYAEETDCFVRLSCPNYDKDDLWAVRTVNGGWFTMDVQSGWQGGSLDVTGKIYQDIISNYESNGWDTSGYTEATYNKKL